MNDKFKPYLRRLALSFLVAFICVGLINEGSHLILKEEGDRPPETVELVIPPGTAERIAAGETPPTIPDDLVFTIGDTLKVINQDDVPHELGVLYIPPGASASLLMEDAHKYQLGCSFTPSRFLNFDVRSRTTATIRLEAFAFATPPAALFLFVYSLLIFPLEGKRRREADVA